MLLRSSPQQPHFPFVRSRVRCPLPSSAQEVTVLDFYQPLKVGETKLLSRVSVKPS